MIRVRSYTHIPILTDRHPFNPLLRDEAVWAVRHPNKKMKRSYEWHVIGNMMICVGWAEWMMNIRWRYGHVRPLIELQKEEEE